MLRTNMFVPGIFYDRHAGCMQAALRSYTSVCGLQYDRKIRLVWPRHYVALLHVYPVCVRDS